MVGSDGAGGLSDAQIAAHWMPFTGNRGFRKDPRLIASADGKYYTTADNRRVFDGLSGLWNCGAGHRRPEIIEAVSRQVHDLDYSPAFQFGHPGAFKLAERIVQFMPAGLNRVFFTCSGSESVDTSLKIARAYWKHRGKPEKTRLIGRNRGYHGVNMGGTSVGGIEPNRAPYGELVTAMHLPDTSLPENRFSKGMPEHGAELADELLNLIKQHDASTMAAVIVEPLAGSTGVLPPPQGYLQRIREICDEHDLLLIFDEVITAFGRMGSRTGAEAFGVVPDIMALSKQLTNGAIPMGAVVVRQRIQDVFMESDAPEYVPELPHGYTCSAHPVACAAGLAALDILEKDGLIDRVADIAQPFEDALHSLADAPCVTDIRNYGLAGALEFETSKHGPAQRPFDVGMKMWEKGFYVRFAGDTIQLGLPFTVDQQEIEDLIGALDDSIRQLQ